MSDTMTSERPRARRRIRPVSRLELVRRERRMPQADLAERIGRAVSTISSFEGGIVPPGEIRALIASTLKVPQTDLWPDEPVTIQEPR